jgi:hypothetical protein
MASWRKLQNIANNDQQIIIEMAVASTGIEAKSIVAYFILVYSWHRC